MSKVWKRQFLFPRGYLIDVFVDMIRTCGGQTMAQCASCSICGTRVRNQCGIGIMSASSPATY